MNNGYSRSQQRREAARKYAVQCMNARGEVECSECNAGVDEARGNRNAQELDREGIRKSSKGPICNACQASWRYSHHQEPEMANAKDDNGPSDADVHAMAQKMFKDSWDNLSSKQQDQVYEALEKEMKNASGCGICGEKGHVYDVDGDKKILCEKHAKESGGVLLSNATEKVCAGCGHDWSAHYPAHPDDHSKSGQMCESCSISESKKKDHSWREVQNDQNDKSKCARCGESTGKDGSLGVEHGYDVYCVDCAVEKGYIEKKDVPGYENADNAKCQCGHTYDQHSEDSDGTMPCNKCSCSSYYPERGFKDHIKGLEK